MISVIIPVLNEEENVVPLLEEISFAAQTIPISEIIFVDDGSGDNTYKILRAKRAEHVYLRVIKHKNTSGQSAALWTGIKAAGNDLIVTLDGDGQNDPADIKLLYEKYKKFTANHAKVMIVGERKKRHDTWIRRVSSRIANGIRSKMLSDQTHDTGCSLKFFKRQDFLNLPYFDHMHRFLPALMMRDGVQLLHVGVSHRPRQSGKSKYGTLDRLFVGIVDLFGVRWLQTRSRRVFDAVEDLN